MTDQLDTLCQRLKQMGYAKNRQMRMYGEELELVSDPVGIGENLIVVDAIERNSRAFRRVRLPLTIVNMLRRERAA